MQLLCQGKVSRDPSARVAIQDLLRAVALGEYCDLIIRDETLCVPLVLARSRMFGIETSLTSTVPRTRASSSPVISAGKKLRKIDFRAFMSCGRGADRERVRQGSASHGQRVSIADIIMVSTVPFAGLGPKIKQSFTAAVKNKSVLLTESEIEDADDERTGIPVRLARGSLAGS